MQYGQYNTLKPSHPDFIGQLVKNLPDMIKVDDS